MSVAQPGRLSLLVVALLGVSAFPARADAAFEPFALAGGGQLAGNPAPLQADYSYDPAVSGDGAYIAFVGSFASKPGIYRKALGSGALEPVVEDGESVTAADKTAGAGSPSISEDGRYVSFTSDEDPLTHMPLPNRCTSVYVRDMAKAPGEPGAYLLASAKSGSEESLSYEAVPGQPCGAAAAYRVALSADGSKVAFTVLSGSDLTGRCPGADSQPELERGCPQVAVRNLENKSTTLVSATLASQEGGPLPVPGGAALAGVPTPSGEEHLPSGALRKLPQSASTAAISAKGNAVAWMGIDIPAQADVTGLPASPAHPNEYAEPLWRRIEPEGPTRRVLAGDDPSAHSCPPQCPGGLDLTWDEQDLNEYAGLNPQKGSYIAEATNYAHLGFRNVSFQSSLDAVTPQLSADGNEVAILATQPDYGQDPAFGLISPQKLPPANAFVVNMSPGLTRAQAIVRLTEWSSIDFPDEAENGPIGDIALSPDGSRVAFTTTRVDFPLAPPALITPPPSQAIFNQLYEANLPAGTLSLVSQGYEGQPADQQVFAASLSDDGGVVALASAATNLAFGAIDQGSDVFVTREIDSPSASGEQSITATPLLFVEQPAWKISATATGAAGGGALLVDVSVPGAGSLGVSASAAVPSAVTIGGRSGRGKTRGHAKRTSTARARTVTAIADRQVAHASAAPKRSELIQLRLTPLKRYRSLVDGRNGLYATIAVAFTAPGHRKLTLTLQADFPRPYPLYRVPKHNKRKPKRHSRKPAGRRTP